MAVTEQQLPLRPSTSTKVSDDQPLLPGMLASNHWYGEFLPSKPANYNPNPIPSSSSVTSKPPGCKPRATTVLPAWHWSTPEPKIPGSPARLPEAISPAKRSPRPRWGARSTAAGRARRGSPEAGRRCEIPGVAHHDPACAFVSIIFVLIFKQVCPE